MIRPLPFVTFVVLALCGSGCANEPRTAQELLKQVTREADPQARGAMVERFLATRGGFRPMSFPVSRFVLYSSRASQGGGPYIVEADYPLRGRGTGLESRYASAI